MLRCLPFSRGLDEIHEAYRLKSKKHHPDLGGDGWGFRMVTRAYEVLKTTTTAPAQSTPRIKRRDLERRREWTDRKLEKKCWTNSEPLMST